METIGLSVRQLVEFTLHPEDLSFTPQKAMIDGTKAHQNRQGLYPVSWEREVSLTLTIEEKEAIFIISGRMDGYLPDPLCPTIDEIKLYSLDEPLVAPLPPHLAQGLCYGHILCVNKGFQKVNIQITYVNISGESLYAFKKVYHKKHLLLQLE